MFIFCGVCSCQNCQSLVHYYHQRTHRENLIVRWFFRNFCIFKIFEPIILWPVFFVQVFPTYLPEVIKKTTMIIILSLNEAWLSVIRWPILVTTSASVTCIPNANLYPSRSMWFVGIRTAATVHIIGRNSLLILLPQFHIHCNTQCHFGFNQVNNIFLSISWSSMFVMKMSRMISSRFSKLHFFCFSENAVKIRVEIFVYDFVFPRGYNKI